MAAPATRYEDLRLYRQHDRGGPGHLNFQKRKKGCGCIVRDPSHMIKKDQLIAGVDATLWLGHRYVRLRADQGLDNEQVRR